MPHIAADPLTVERPHAVLALPDMPALLSDAEWQAMLLPLMSLARNTLPGETS